MTPEQWGPPIWTLFHCLAEKIKEESFPLIGKQLFSFIYKIASFLPCPDCSQHAKTFLGKINPHMIKTKADLVNTLFLFHNTVNKRKNNPLLEFKDLENKYKNHNIRIVFNRFCDVYNTKGNMKLLTDSFHRNMLLQNLKRWIQQNKHHFTN